MPLLLPCQHVARIKPAQNGALRLWNSDNNITNLGVRGICGTSLKGLSREFNIASELRRSLGWPDTWPVIQGKPAVRLLSILMPWCIGTSEPNRKEHSLPNILMLCDR